MNAPIAAASALTILALGAHAVIGTRESLSVRPPDGSRTRAWVQSMCGWQMVTADLAAVAVVDALLALTDWVPASRTVALAIGALYASWGLAWLAQLAALRRPAGDYLALGQWIFCLACAALMVWGASDP